MKRNACASCSARADNSVAPCARSWMARSCSAAAAATACASWLDVWAPLRACPRVSVIFVASWALWRPTSATCLPERGLGRGVRDAIEILQPGGGILDDLAQIAANSFDQLRRAIQSAAGVLHRLADVPGLTSAGLRQLVHLTSHDREPAAVNSGARRFDRGVEREEIGLIGDEPDRLRKLLDLRRHVAQSPDLRRAFFGCRT